MSWDFDAVVIGAGVIGLAIARAFCLKGQSVLVLEKNGAFGEETSSRNSEVIHAGIYYKKSSLKAKLCVEGKALLYDYCEANHIPHKRIEKLIVATNEEELVTLDTISQAAAANGVTDLRRLTKAEALSQEPHLFCTGALLSPSTGIIDTHQYMLSLVGDIESQGGQIAFNSPFDKAETIAGGFRISSGETELTARNIVNAAGLGAQKAAEKIKPAVPFDIPARYLAKGTYFTAHIKSPFSKLIYPVPNTASLGIHVTLDMAGQIRFGPDQEWVEDINYDLDPARADAFYDAIRRYYPDLEENSLVPAYTGIRPKLQHPGGSVRDFQISGPKDHGNEGLVLLFGMESPGLTSSLAIGSYVEQLLCE